MKKTMFITSVIMVVVLAIALTTSSLAWFSAGGTQTVSTAAVTISTKASSASAGLEISANNSIWHSQNPSGGLTLTTRSGGATTELDPAAPVLQNNDSAPAGGSNLTDSEKAAQGLVLYNAILNAMTNDTKRVENNSSIELQFDGTASAAKIYASDVYLRNSGNADCTVDIDVTLTPNTSTQAETAVFWYAIFELTEANNEVTGATLLKLSQVGYEEKNDFLLATDDAELSSPAPVASVPTLCVISHGSDVSVTTPITGTLSLEAAVTDATGAVTSMTVHHLALVAWYDGRFLVSENSDTSVQASVEFSVH